MNNIRFPQQRAEVSASSENPRGVSVVAAVALPPPVAGQSIAGKMLLDALRAAGVPVYPINLSRELSGANTKLKYAARAADGLGFLVSLLRARFVFGRKTIFYIQIGLSVRGVLRDLPLLMAASRLHMPLVVHLHGEGLRRSVSSLPRPIGALLKGRLASVARAIVLSEALRSEVLDLVPAGRVTVISNGAERSVVCGLRSGTRGRISCVNVLYLSNLIRSKGYDTVLEVARRSQDSGHGFKFIFAGAPGAGCAELPTEYARRLGLTNIEWCGVVSGNQKTEILRSADVLLLPSESEGQPLAILEAMHAGAVVVASAVGGIPDVIVDNVNGLLIQPRSPEAVLEALCRLESSGELMRRLSEAAQSDAQALYTEERHSCAMVELLSRVWLDNFSE